MSVNANIQYIYASFTLAAICPPDGYEEPDVSTTTNMAAVRGSFDNIPTKCKVAKAGKKTLR